MTSVRPDLVVLEALGPRGRYRARSRRIVCDVRGIPAAELSLVPGLFVQRTLAALRRAAPMPARDRLGALARAGRVFHTETVAGLAPEEYQGLTSRISGVPISVVQSSSRRLVDWTNHGAAALDAARPWTAVSDWRNVAPGGSPVWSRRGDVFAVNAAGNHPGLHLEWLDALALGYRVAVRPSRREPLTPHRLISALRASGFADDQVALLPTEHEVAGQLIRFADLAMVYGGDEVMRAYGSQTTVRPMGPGRSKILLAADANWLDHIDNVVSSVVFEAGVGCVNASAVLVEGDPRPVAEAIADRLRDIPSLPPEEPDAQLPVQPEEDAARLQEFVNTASSGAKPFLGGDGITDLLGDGSAVLRPAVYGLSECSSQIGVELPFPCVWVAPWNRAKGLEPLKESLVLSVATEDPTLIDALANEPTIRNLHLGAEPTYYTKPGLPHDGFLADFLMSAKSIVRGAGDEPTHPGGQTHTDNGGSSGSSPI